MAKVPAWKGRMRRMRALQGSAAVPRPLTPAQKLRREKIAKLEAGRRASAKARAARGPATTKAQLAARQKTTRKEPVPLTPSQKAEVLRGRLTKGITPIERLTEALTPQTRKKK